MRELRDRRGLRKTLFSSVLILLLAGLLFLSARGLLSVYERYSQARLLRNAAEQRLSSLEERKLELEEALANLESERGFEEEVRKRFGVVLPGEKVIEIIDAPQAEEPSGERRGILERIFDLF